MKSAFPGPAPQSHSEPGLKAPRKPSHRMSQRRPKRIRIRTISTAEALRSAKPKKMCASAINIFQPPHACADSRSCVVPSRSRIDLPSFRQLWDGSRRSSAEALSGLRSSPSTSSVTELTYSRSWCDFILKANVLSSAARPVGRVRCNDWLYGDYFPHGLSA